MISIISAAHAPPALGGEVCFGGVRGGGGRAGIGSGLGHVWRDFGQRIRFSNCIKTYLVRNLVLEYSTKVNEQIFLTIRRYT